MISLAFFGATYALGSSLKFLRHAYCIWFQLRVSARCTQPVTLELTSTHSLQYNGCRYKGQGLVQYWSSIKCYLVAVTSSLLHKDKKNPVLNQFSIFLIDHTACRGNTKFYREKESKNWETEANNRSFEKPGGMQQQIFKPSILHFEFAF